MTFLHIDPERKKIHQNTSKFWISEVMKRKKKEKNRPFPLVIYEPCQPISTFFLSYLNKKFNNSHHTFRYNRYNLNSRGHVARGKKTKCSKLKKRKSIGQRKLKSTNENVVFKDSILFFSYTSVYTGKKICTCKTLASYVIHIQKTMHRLLSRFPFFQLSPVIVIIPWPWHHHRRVGGFLVNCEPKVQRSRVRGNRVCYWSRFIL